MITEQYSDKYRIIKLSGRLDTHTAPKFEQYLKDNLKNDELKIVVFDFNALEFISSAGLRVCVATFGRIQSLIILCKRDSEIYDPFEMTGLSETLTIQEYL